MLVLLAVPARFQPLPEGVYRFKTAPNLETKPRIRKSHPRPPSPPGGHHGSRDHLGRTGLPDSATSLEYRSSVQQFSVDPNPTPLPYNPNPHRDLPMLLENTNNPIRLIVGADHHQPYSHIERPIHLADRIVRVFKKHRQVAMRIGIVGKRRGVRINR